MSVVVRMEMPNGCHDCKLRNMVGNCQIPMFDGQDEEKIWTLEECFQRPPWCPIVCSLPEGHGRLVDADELRREMYHEAFETDTNMQKWDSGCWIRYKMFENTIGAVPTIVPAEAERSET